MIYFLTENENLDCFLLISFLVAVKMIGLKLMTMLVVLVRLETHSHPLYFYNLVGIDERKGVAE